MTDLLRQEIASLAHTIVVKVGTHVLTGDDGRLDDHRIRSLASQIHHVIQSGRKVVLVSSGAVGSGMGRLGLKERPTKIQELQAVAAVGQSLLVEAYERCLSEYGPHASQVLLTAEDLDRGYKSYFNARNTLRTLMEFGAVPIINENDTVSTRELKNTFGDNDYLAALVTNLLQAPLLVLLSDVDGLYDGDPRDPQSRLIPTVEKIDKGVRSLVRDKKGQLSKGGMDSKLRAARVVTTAGENMIIANGRDPQVLEKIIRGEPVGTLFLAVGRSWSSRSRRIAGARTRGAIVVDAGARTAIEQQRRSLLPVGIVAVTGEFAAGEIVRLRDSQGEVFARGITNYSSTQIQLIRRKKGREIPRTLGLPANYHPPEEVVHRDNMVLTE